MLNDPKSWNNDRLGRATNDLLNEGKLEEGCIDGLSPFGGIELSEYSSDEMTLIFDRAGLTSTERAELIADSAAYNSRK